MSHRVYDEALENSDPKFFKTIERRLNFLVIVGVLLVANMLFIGGLLCDSDGTVDNPWHWVLIGLSAPVAAIFAATYQVYARKTEKYVIYYWPEFGSNGGPALEFEKVLLFYRNLDEPAKDACKALYLKCFEIFREFKSVGSGYDLTDEGYKTLSSSTTQAISKRRAAMKNINDAQRAANRRTNLTHEDNDLQAAEQLIESLNEMNSMIERT